jgi:hypothetical protein
MTSYAITAAAIEHCTVSAVWAKNPNFRETCRGMFDPHEPRAEKARAIDVGLVDRGRCRSSCGIKSAQRPEV